MGDAEQMDGIAAYGAAWLESDPDRRMALLERAWAPDAVYCDPTDWVPGRAALAEHIGNLQAMFPGGRVEVTGEPVRHHDSATFPWRIVDGEGSVVVSGFDVVQLDEADRISRLTGFFDA